MRVNENAGLIWNLCDGQRSLAEIAALLAGHYPEAVAEIERDLSDAVSQMVDAGVMRLSEPAPGQPNSTDHRIKRAVAEGKPHRFSTDSGEPKLSIIIPHCNEYQNLFMTLQNMSIQIERDNKLSNAVEIIVVDNLSEDIEDDLTGRSAHRDRTFKVHHRTNVLEFLPQQWLATTGILRVIDFADDQSIWKTRQAGLDVARGEFIMFSDAHVLHEAGAFPFGIETLERHPQIGELHGGHISFFTSPASILYQYELELEKNFWGSWTKAVPNYVDSTTPFKIPMSGHATVFYRKDDYHDLGRVPEKAGIYGGEEAFNSMQTWMLGKEVWSDPRIRYHHLSDRRGYVFNNKDFVMNTFLVAYLLGGESWLDTLYNRYKGEYAMQYHGDLDWAREVSLSCKADHQRIMSKVRFSLDEVLVNEPWSSP